MSVSSLWFTWLAGGVVLAALAHFQSALAAFPVYFSELSPQSVHHGWQAGWPIPFGQRTVTGEIAGFQPLALVSDLVFALIVVLGTMASVQHWLRGKTILLPAPGLTLGVLAVTLLTWLALLQTLNIPLRVLLGWAALAVIFLAVPCAAYSLVTYMTRMTFAPRFSLRVLLVVVTLLCFFAAAFAWRQNALRAARRAQVPSVRVESMDYGLMETVDTIEIGRRVAREYRITRRTTTIPCKLDSVFGVEYVLAIDQPGSKQGTPRKDSVNLHFVWHYPAQIIDPQRGTSERESTRDMHVLAGTRHVEVFWLGSEPYLVPGRWQLEIWQNTGFPGERRKLLEQEFVIREE